MTDRAVFWRGFRDCAPFSVIVVPYSMLFGVLARDAGLEVYEVVAMSALVVAGASQFTALALMQEHAPVIVILAASLAVNMRMAMYSAALSRHLGHLPLRWRALIAYMMVDQSFALSIRRYEEDRAMPASAKAVYYFGTLTAAAPLWYACTWLGAVVGQAIPPMFSLDFAVPVCFIAIAAPMLRSPAHVAAATVSVLAAIAFSWMPWNLWLIAAAALAMAAGAQTEWWLRRRAGT